MVAVVAKPLTDRWFPLDWHEVQAALWESTARFRVVPAGRRSGKTEIAKRWLVLQALAFTKPDGRFICAAPTFGQAREIFWEDLLSLLPEWAVVKTNETRMHVWLINGVKIMVVGLDKAQRIEGKHLDGIIIDEIADCKPHVWPRHIRPMLSSPGRFGWAWFIGVPEGFNHFYELWERANDDSYEDWEGFSWPSDGIMDPSELLAAARDEDPVSFAQEYGGQFRSMEGRAYHQFSRPIHAKGRLQYDPRRPLHLCFDFNNKPGVMAIAQLLPPPRWLEGVPETEQLIPCFIDEIWIASDSTTYKVCDAFLAKYEGIHEAEVFVYGDATGGAKGSNAVKGSDWDLVDEKLKPVFAQQGYRRRVPKANPYVRPRLNAFNRMCRNAVDEIHIAVDKRCRRLISSLENTQVNSDGEVIKPEGEIITHMGEAASYFIAERYPVRKKQSLKQKAA